MSDAVQSLLVKEKGGGERVVPLDRDAITIGRDLNSTIRLDSPFVSRNHARVEVRGADITLVDLGSRNGSNLNGARVEGEAVLSAGDVISIADVTIECLAEAGLDGTTRTFVPVVEAIQDQMRVDAQAYQVFIGEKLLERRLSAQEFELLRTLYQHRDRVCPRQELGDAIWGAGNWDPNMLHRLVHRLKEKVEPNPEKPRYVQTVPWVGYRLTV